MSSGLCSTPLISGTWRQFLETHTTAACFEPLQAKQPCELWNTGGLFSLPQRGNSLPEEEAQGKEVLHLKTRRQALFMWVCSLTAAWITASRLTDTPTATHVLI